MDKLNALLESHGWRNVADLAWEWSAGLDVEKMHTVEGALASDGVDGIVDLLLAGPALGGLDQVDVEGLATLAELRLGPLALAA